MAIYKDILDIGDGYASALGSISNISKAAASTANKVKSLIGNHSNPSEIRDLITNGFLSGNSKFSPNFFVRAFDEPTYLTFRIEFIFSGDPEMQEYNIAYNNAGLLSSAIATANYATMYDKMPEPFLQDPGTAKMSNGDDSSYGSWYSTEKYLDLSLGDHGRASLLATFKLALKDIQTNFPYYFHELNGISDLVKIDPKSGMRNFDTKLDLTCYEGIDLKITQLINLYRKICWDDVYQRWVLPDMMRYFGMRIYVSEIRTFHDRVTVNSITGAKSKLFGRHIDDFTDPDIRNMTARGEIPGTINAINSVNSAVKQGTAISNAFLGTKSYISKALNYTAATLTTASEAMNSVFDIATDIMKCNNSINEIMPTICFDCHMCEFDISDSLSYMNGLHSNMADTKALEPTLSIKIGKVYEKHSYLLNATERAYQDTGRYIMTPGEFWELFKGKRRQDSEEEEDLDGSATKGKYSYIREQRRSKTGLMFLGNIFSDKVFDKQYKRTDSSDQNTIMKRLEDYVDNLIHDMGDARANMITVRRLGEITTDNKNPETLLINKILQDEMSYNNDTMTDQIAMLSLIGQTLNEYTYINRYYGDGQDVLGGSDSVATHPDKSMMDSINGEGRRIIDKILGTPVSKATEEDNEIQESNLTEENIKTPYSLATDDDNDIQLGYPLVPPDSDSEATDDDSIEFGYPLVPPDSSSKATDDDTKIEFGYPINRKETEEKLKALQDVGEALFEAAEKIYDGDEINQLNVSDNEKASIADNLFAEFIENLSQSTATDENSILHKLLINYKGLKLYDEYKSTATTSEINKESSLKGFSALN